MKFWYDKCVQCGGVGMESGNEGSPRFARGGVYDRICGRTRVTYVDI